MDVAIRHHPSFAVARCTLGADEALKAEAGAMMAHSVGVAVEAKVQGGLMKGLKRSFGRLVAFDPSVESWLTAERPFSRE